MASCVKHGEWERKYLACPKCFEDGDVNKPLYCNACGGSGETQVYDTTRGPDGETYDIACEECEGTGTRIGGRADG